VTPAAASASREAAKFSKIDEIRRKSADYLETVSAGRNSIPRTRTASSSTRWRISTITSTAGSCTIANPSRKPKISRPSNGQAKGRSSKTSWGASSSIVLGGFGVYNMASATRRSSRRSKRSSSACRFRRRSCSTRCAVFSPNYWVNSHRATCRIAFSSATAPMPSKAR